jgi:hypothetical protein
MPHHRGRPRGAVSLAMVVLVLTTCSTARAGKWDGGCPEPKVRLYKVSNSGFATSPFAHVGHDVTFQVREQLALTGEGFSSEPNGNTVQTTFTPLGGDPIPLPPFTVTAISPMTLRFPVPDTRPILGRLVVGPARFVITRADGSLVMSTTKHPTILPPMNDMRDLSNHNGEVELMGTLDHTGRNMWIPISFAGFGQGDPMPSCPTATLTPITAFAVDLTLRKRDGEFIPHAGFTNLQKTTMYFGDYDLWGLNLYGTRFANLGRLRRLRDGGLSLCKLNDTFDLVMMIRLQQASRGPNSEIIPIQQDGSPFTMRLRNISAEVSEDLSQLPIDSLGAICPVAP